MHKWLGTPLGAGLLYVRRDQVAKLWPSFGDAIMADDDIRKLNHTGTHPVHTDLAINVAIAFYERIGIQRKQARLRFLRSYWTTKARAIPNLVFNTPAAPERTCAIANVGVKGMTPAVLAKTLLEKHKIWTVAINRPGVQGVRITPQLFTTTAELDRFVKALSVIAAG